MSASDARDAFMGAVAALGAAISLLERGGKKAAPSDKMFAVMLKDYRRALKAARGRLRAGWKLTPPAPDYPALCARFVRLVGEAVCDPEMGVSLKAELRDALKAAEEMGVRPRLSFDG